MPPEPVRRTPTDLEKRREHLRKNANAAKTSRGNKKKGIDAYKSYHHEMELWLPQFQAKHDRLLYLLQQARPRFGADLLGREIEKALAEPTPKIPDTVVIERTEKSVGGGAGRPAVLVRRSSREHTVNNLSRSEFKAPVPPITQSTLACPPPAINFLQFLDPYEFEKDVEQPDMELWGVDSAYNSSSFSPPPSESYDDGIAGMEALRETVSYGAGFTREDTTFIKDKEGMKDGFEFLQGDLNEAERRLEVALANWENGNQLC